MTDLITAPNTDIQKAYTRLDDHEKRLVRLESSELVAAERHKSIEKSLTSIEANQSRVVWLILASLVAAIMGFALTGGLNVQ